MTDELAAWRSALDAEPQGVRQEVLGQIKVVKRKSKLAAAAKKAENLIKGAWKSWLQRQPEWRYPNATAYIQAQKAAFLSRH